MAETLLELTPDQKEERLFSARAARQERQQRQARQNDGIRSDEDKERDRAEIKELNPQNILVVCYSGTFRSGEVSRILDEWGYDADRTNANSDASKETLEPDGYDLVLYMTPRIQQDYEVKFEGGDTQFPVSRVLNLVEHKELHGSQGDAFATQATESLKDIGLANKTSEQDPSFNEPEEIVSLI